MALFNMEGISATPTSSVEGPRSPEVPPVSRSATLTVHSPATRAEGRISVIVVQEDRQAPKTAAQGENKETEANNTGEKDQGRKT